MAVAAESAEAAEVAVAGEPAPECKGVKRRRAQVFQLYCPVPDKNVLKLDVAVGHASSV